MVVFLCGGGDVCGSGCMHVVVVAIHMEVMVIYVWQSCYNHV